MKTFTTTTGRTCQYQIEQKGWAITSAISWSCSPTLEEEAELENYIIQVELGLTSEQVETNIRFCGVGVQGRAKMTEGIRQYLKDGEGEQQSQ